MESGVGRDMLSPKSLGKNSAKTPSSFWWLQVFLGSFFYHSNLCQSPCGL
jgi:hypothetical protein